MSRRFQFSVKAVFVLMTVTAILLGFAVLHPPETTIFAVLVSVVVAIFAIGRFQFSLTPGMTPRRLFVFSALMAWLAVAAWSSLATHYRPELGHLRVAVWWAVVAFFFFYSANIHITSSTASTTNQTSKNWSTGKNTNRT